MGKRFLYILHSIIVLAVCALNKKIIQVDLHIIIAAVVCRRVEVVVVVVEVEVVVVVIVL